MATKPMKKKVIPVKKPAPKAAPSKPVQKATPAKKQIIKEDDSTLDITAVLAGCPTDVIADALLAEAASRVDYVIESKDDSAEDIADLWTHIKRIEQHMVNVRRALEDALVSVFPVDEDDEEALESTSTHEIENFKLKITRKMNRTVDADKLTALSEEYEIDDEIARLFRFKPELNLAAYRAESEETQELFNTVIITKPARPSITITADEE